MVSLTAERQRVRRQTTVNGYVFTGLGLALLLVTLLKLNGTQWYLPALCLAYFVVLAGVKRILKANSIVVDLTAWLCGTWLGVIVLTAVVAPWLPLADPQDLSAAMMNPALAAPDLFSAHPFGTNNFGLDLMSRTIYGARISLVVALGSVGVGLIVGGVIGVLGGYFRGPFDRVAGVFTNSLLAVPPLVLLIALASVLPPTLSTMMLGLSLLAIPSMIRMARANTIALAQREFVEAAKSMGATSWRIIGRDLIPNVLLPMLSYAMIIVSVLIVAEASLSFLGLGIKPPEPSWGNLIAEGEGGVFERAPHIVLVPGVALFLTVYSLNVLGEKARKRWDPRQSKI